AAAFAGSLTGSAATGPQIRNSNKQAVILLAISITKARFKTGALAPATPMCLDLGWRCSCACTSSTAGARRPSKLFELRTDLCSFCLEASLNEQTSRHVCVMYSPQSGQSLARFARPLCADDGHGCYHSRQARCLL